jgi:hypothetical protein
MKRIFKAALLSISVLGAISSYGEGENLLPGTEFSPENKWDIYTNANVIDAGGSVKIKDGMLVVDSPSYDKQNAWNIQVCCKVDLPVDKVYTLKLKIKSDTNGDLFVSYAQRRPPYAQYAITLIKVQEGERDYTCKLAIKKDKDGNYESPRGVVLMPGGFKDANLTFQNVSLEEVKPVTAP